MLRLMGKYKLSLLGLEILFLVLPCTAINAEEALQRKRHTHSTKNNSIEVETTCSTGNKLHKQNHQFIIWRLKNLLNCKFSIQCFYRVLAKKVRSGLSIPNPSGCKLQIVYFLSESFLPGGKQPSFT